MSMPPLPAKTAGSYRLLHTADWHLGKLLNEQSRDEEHRRFLEWLLATVAGQQVDAIILAGDIFDSANPPQSASKRYFDFVSALFRQKNCALVVVAGNHDSPAQLEAPRQVLHSLNVHVVGFMAEEAEARILCLPDRQNPKVALAMLPFLRDRDLRIGRPGESADEIRAQIAAGIRLRYEETAAAAEAMNLPCPVLAMGHLTVLGAKTSDSERDIHIGGLGAVTAGSFSETYAYVALGHLHRPQATDGMGRVRYAGSPLALSFSEAADEKEVRIIDVQGKRVTQSSLAIPVFRRLIQIRSSQAGLEAALRNFKSEQAELSTWAEVVVEDATFAEDLSEQIRVLAEMNGLEVLKVLRANASSVAGMSAGETTDDEAIETLLDQPQQVFAHLISQQKNLSAEDGAKLETVFARLVDLDSQAEATAQT